MYYKPNITLNNLIKVLYAYTKLQPTLWIQKNVLLFINIFKLIGGSFTSEKKVYVYVQKEIYQANTDYTKLEMDFDGLK